MATRDAELSVLVRSLSKWKSTGSMLMLTELNKRISLQERVYRKRKLKSMVTCLLFLLSYSTVERLVWQRQRSNAWFELAYQTFSDNEWFENFRVSRNTFHFLSPEPHGFFTAHVISEIVTQTDVSIKKWVRTCIFSGSGAIESMAPKPEKTRVCTHPPKHGTDCLHGQKCEVRTTFLTGPYPIFLPWKRPLKLLNRQS